MCFEAFLSEVTEKYKAFQEISSSVYAVVPSNEQTFLFCCYFDVDSFGMRTTICDSAFTEIKLLSDIPPTVLVEYTDFISNIDKWIKGELVEFPYTKHSGENALNSLSEQ